jgi:hypothetical protein
MIKIITWDNETNAHQDVNPVDLFEWTVPRVKFSHFIVWGDRGAIFANFLGHGADEIIICRVENGTTLQFKSLSMIERPFRIFYWRWGIPNLDSKTISINYIWLLFYLLTEISTLMNSFLGSTLMSVDSLKTEMFKSGWVVFNGMTNDLPGSPTKTMDELDLMCLYCFLSTSSMKKRFSLPAFVNRWFN